MISLKETSKRFLPFGGPRRISIVGENADADRDRRWAKWIGRMGNGDLQALSAFYDESSPVIFSLVLRILNDRNSAENLLVEIYDLARKEASKFDSRRQSALDWLISRAQNQATQYLRWMAPVVDAPVDVFKHKRQLASLALARLSVEERDILEMTYLGGLNASQIADSSGVSTAYVTEQIVLAMRKLRAGGARVSDMPGRRANAGSF
jgi:RNA polymerase sigma-70 factor (ECF subfamily)